MSEVRATTVSDIAGTGPVTLTGQYAAKSWVNFNGTGTAFIRQSGNISSLTDNNTGVYTLGFTVSFVDNNYAGGGFGGDANGGGATDNTIITTSSQTTSTVNVLTRNVQASGAVHDPSVATLTITR